jgi:hypothetical protein
MAERRFPPPWSIDELNDACFIVRDSNGQQLAYVYCENEPGRRSAAKLLSKMRRDVSRRISPNCRSCSGLMMRPQSLVPTSNRILKLIRTGSLTQIKVILSGQAENSARPVAINHHSVAST